MVAAGGGVVRLQPPCPKLPSPHSPPACVSGPGYIAEAHTASRSLKLTYLSSKVGLPTVHLMTVHLMTGRGITRSICLV